jgi:4-amino-4-deoxy-L-arabinose transferase-like glycosyltransferase
VEAGVKNTRRWSAVLGVVATVAAALLFFGITKSPPGFYIDESSIAYNAHTIARTGTDEHGFSWPLYFRAFGEYKNPVYIYILAAIFRLTGPSILAARALSATVIVLAAAGLGLLAWRLTRSRIIALLTAIFALITPWLFEVGHVVLEVTLYPLACALFFLCLQRAALKNKWSIADVITLAATLALLTYAYSIGRLLGPLLALGLLFFWTRQRWPAVLAVLGFYAALVFPILMFSLIHPGSLAWRFNMISYLNPHAGFAEIVSEFAKHYLLNLSPRGLLLRGDPNRDQVAHVYGTCYFLAPIFVFSIAGAGLILGQARTEPWARFLIYGFAVSIIPASLTSQPLHMFRLIAVPVFLLVFAIPGIEWFMEQSRRALLVTLVGLTIVQAAFSQWNYHRKVGTSRGLYHFDDEYRTKIFEPAIASNANPIYLADLFWMPGYIQAYWYGTLKGIDLSRFHRLPLDEPVPLGGLVISAELNCPGCEILAAAPPYVLAIAKEAPRPRTPLPPEALRAELSVVGVPPRLRTKQRAVFSVRIKNASHAVWFTRERDAQPHQIRVGNHWLDTNGTIRINDDGRSALLSDLPPGEIVELPLTVNAPSKAGRYLLEIDMLQEGVSWFGAAGSSTVRIPVEVQ